MTLFSVLVLSLAAAGAAVLTFFSGFGLGTLLLPIFALFYPLDVAVGATAVVHLANNLFKAGLVGKHANWRVVLSFGLPSIPAAVAGALALSAMAGADPLWRYKIGEKICVVTLDGLIISTLILAFAVIEFLPESSQIRLSPRWLPAGGVGAGFIGGISGHQGALRSAVLSRAGLTREAFIGSGVICAILVDLSRIPVYLRTFSSGAAGNLPDPGDWTPILAGTVSAFLGAYLGSRLWINVTMVAIQRTIGALLIALSIALGAGII